MPFRGISGNRPDGPAQRASDPNLVFRFVEYHVKGPAEYVLERRLPCWSPLLGSAQRLSGNLPLGQATAAGDLALVPVRGGANGGLIGSPGAGARPRPRRNPQRGVVGDGGEQDGFIVQFRYP